MGQLACFDLDGDKPVFERCVNFKIACNNLSPVERHNACLDSS